jgi:hypothetical protein
MPTSGCRSIGIVRSRTKATAFSMFSDNGFGLLQNSEYETLFYPDIGAQVLPTKYINLVKLSLCLIKDHAVRIYGAS